VEAHLGIRIQTLLQSKLLVSISIFIGILSLMLLIPAIYHQYNSFAFHAKPPGKLVGISHYGQHMHFYCTGNTSNVIIIISHFLLSKDELCSPRIGNIRKLSRMDFSSKQSFTEKHHFLLLRQTWSRIQQPSSIRCSYH
jgi:hypothetical protein